MKIVPCFVLFCSCLLMSEITTAQDKPMTDKKDSTVKTFHIEATINASIETCWEAWTDVSIAKQWLGTTFSGTKVGDDYRVSTLIPYLSGRHKILAIEKKKSLKLQYFIDGWAAELTVKFEKVKSSNTPQTKITLDCSVETKNAPQSIEPFTLEGRIFYFIGGSWNHAMCRMRSVIEDGNEGVIMPLQNNDHIVNLTVDIRSTPEKIYKSLLDVKTMRFWGSDLVTEGAEIDPKVSGIYSYGWYPKGTPEKDLHDGPNKLLKLEKNKLIVHDWYGGQKVAKITWKIEDKGDGIVQLKFSHSPILGNTHGNVWSYRSGWSEFLYALKWYSERGEAGKDWLISE